MSDANEFLNAYQATLVHEVEGADWPAEILDVYAFESCLKHEPDREVYLVRDKRTGGRAVLRVTSHDAGDRADAEWAILSRLDHPGIPKTYGRLVTENKSYIVREFIPGRALDAVVAQGTLSPQDIFSFTLKLCDILGYLHRQVPPVIHRDIKPQNIILKPDGSIALTDFGIARLYKPGAASDTNYVGTLPYAPPEQYGFAQSTPQTDIYALGIVLVYLATGSPNRQNLAEHVRDKKLLALISRCIAFDPADRFSSVEEVKRAAEGGRSFKPQAIIGIAAACVVVVALIGAFVLFDPVGKITSLVTAGAPTYSSTGSSDAGAPASSGSSTASGSTGSSNLPLSTEGPLFDTTATGNLTGNLTNGGFAVEGDSETYVALDAGIYALADDGSIGRRVVGAQSPHSLNFYDGKLYYADESLGLMCVDPQSGQAASLCSVFVGGIFIDSGTLYFENAEDSLNLYTVGFDGSGMKLVSGSEAEYYRNVVDGWQYFVNADNGETLCRENLATGEEQQLYDIRSAWVSITGSTLYFSDFSIPGAMVSMSLDGSNTEVLFNDSASYVSATPLGVFFTNSDAQQIEVMSLDGNTRTVLTKSTCGAFCVTRNWIIYENKDDNNSLWAMRTDGSESHRLQ